MTDPATSNPTVTVLIPAYNRESYIAAAVDSILAQTFQDFEVLVIDDGSTDATAEIVRAYRDPRVRLLENTTNQGISRTSNRGLDAARGRYVAILDSDDYACPPRLARQVAFLDAHPDHGEVGSWGAWMDGRGRITGKIKQQPLSDGAIRTQLLFSCCINNRSVMGRTALFRALRYPEDQVVSANYEMHRRVIRRHKVANLPEVLVVGRRHGDQITRAQRPESKRTKRAIVGRLLNDIGIEASAEDLERHLALWDESEADARLDREVLLWAREWLPRLRAAIPAERREIEAVLGRLWLKALIVVMRRDGPSHLPRALSAGGGFLVGGAADYLRRAVRRHRPRPGLPDVIGTA
jgi:glycosyltransferase involved in cell wall biosynthesis